MSRIQPPLKSTHNPSQPVRTATAVAEPVSLTDASQQTPLLLLGGLLVLLFAAYLNMFALTSATWFGRDSLYAHGWIIPLFALGILWLRWEPFGAVPSRDRWIGVGLLAFGLCVRLVAATLPSRLCSTACRFLPCIFGVFMMVGGMQAIRWAWPGLLFLVFMFPLPHAFEVLILNRLQRVATISSTFVLQTLGVAAFRDGNLIILPGSDQPMNVAEGCAGLRMATIFARVRRGNGPDYRAPVVG